MVQTVQRSVQIAVAGITVLVVGWLLVATWQVNLPYRNQQALPFALWLVGILAILGGLGIYWLSRRFTGWYLLTLVLASLPKLGLIFLLPIKPQSDMWSYNFEAQMLLARFSWQDLFDKQWLDFSVISPHVFHISSTFHWIYWLTFSHYQVIQLVNIVLVAICSWLIFVLLRRIVSRTAGLIGGLIFFFIPSNYVYSCLMGAEYFQLTAFLLALLGLYRLITSDHGRFWRAALGLIVCLLLVNFYRPNGVVILMAIGLWLVFRIGGNQAGWRKRLLMVALIAGPVLLVDQQSTNLDKLVYGIPIADRSVETAYTLATGWNRNSSGMYNYDLVNRIEEINRSDRPVAQKFTTMQDYLTDNFHKNFSTTLHRGELLTFLHTKLKILVNGNFGFNFFFVENQAQLNRYHVNRDQWRSPVTAFTTAFQLVLFTVLLGTSLVGLLMAWSRYRDNRVQNGFLLMNLLLDGLVLSSLLVEVQPRYQIIWYVPMALLAGAGIAYACAAWSLYRPHVLKWAGLPEF
ncbi:hypothetical protein GPK34_06285 [Secundilactobacillus kimchicus]|uniref:glycosyltransferase family 39 protein n=1 Tax=Secundilactobacillus kimchicus TaxID=528209 RepID=UPI001C00AC1C|nr:glycosyltransferase family 39 protein [Secundilactobacillus kimchicus]MBT9671635.1 hypothetical protein [Secundilactobacillus kimchicus]